jgi:uncharacterized membrane protein (DUF106 family)
MDFTPIIIIAIGFILNLIGFLYIYIGAGSIMNKFGLGFLLGTLLGLIPLIAMVFSESVANSMSESIGPIPSYTLLFAVLVIIFAVLLVLWLRMVDKTSRIHRSADRLRKSIEDANERITNISMEIVNANKSIDDINQRIKSRNEQLTKIQTNPR